MTHIARDVDIRPFPYPFRAMLAICSDLDETRDAKQYFAISRFLNTEIEGEMGPGLGLETGNTIYFQMPEGQFAYWSANEAEREGVRRLIRSGHIDCLHSFGDLAMTRADAARALEELSRHDCRLEVWIDHAVAPTNLGGDIMRGSGDVPGAPAYHADLSRAYGIRYVWRGRVTSVVGQDVGRSLGGILDAGFPLRSAVTLAKEAVKGIVGRTGESVYSMHPPNRLTTGIRLRDGGEAVEFIRMNPSPRGVGLSATADGLPEVLTDPMLDRLERRGGASILYTHLGKNGGYGLPFRPATVITFRRLAERQRTGRILVTTTRRLLRYQETVRAATIRRTPENGRERIEIATTIKGIGLPEGLTVYAEHPERVQLSWNGEPVAGVVANGPDETGRPSVSVPWVKLPFPELPG